MSAKPPKPIETWQHRRLRGLWKELSPSVTIDCPGAADPEKAARLAHTSGKLGRTIGSWTELTKAEAGRLIHAMREDLGRDPKPGEVRSAEKAKPDAIEIMAKLALDLYGGQWYAALLERLQQRPFFHDGPLDHITPRQSHELIEILLDHLERKLYPDDAPMETRRGRKEELRRRFAKKRRRG
jgi:hypothetical protein